MRRALAILAGLGACGGGAKPAPAPAAKAPAPAVEAAYRFDWSPPCRVPVTERSHRKGHDVTMRYAVTVTRLDEQELIVDMVDLELLETNGNDVRGPQYAAVRAHMRDMYVAFPAVIVDNAGNYLRTESLDEIMAFTIRTTPEIAAKGDAYDTPELRAQLAVKFAEPWITWVGHWIEAGLAPGDRHVVQMTTSGPGGAEVPFVATVEHLGLEDGFARLRYSERMDGASLKVMMAPLLRSMSGLAPDPAEAEKFLDEVELEGFREGAYEVETSPLNLRPRRARQDTRLEITINGEPSSPEHEWREYELDWDRAVGCGR